MRVEREESVSYEREREESVYDEREEREKSEEGS